MEPEKSALKQWNATMQALQTLISVLGSDIEQLNILLKGIVLTAFQNPLLRIVTIDKLSCIAHIAAQSGFGIRGLDNPLENTASKGDYRIKIEKAGNILFIEQNTGPRYKDAVEYAIDKSCTEAGNEMTRTGDFMGVHGQQFANMLPLMLKSHGNAFTWKLTTAHQVSEFRALAIIQRENALWYETPTFDLTLTR